MADDLDGDRLSRTLSRLGKTVVHNLPGPSHLAEGFRQTVYPVLPIWGLIVVLLLFGEPFVRWLCS